MNPAITTEHAKVFHGSNLDVLPHLPDNSIDAIVTDPPYELGFMGKSWDNSGIAYSVELWTECLRVLKPGGHLLAFSGSRTYHRMVVAIEDAGFEIRDMIAWVSNKTFPKSHNVEKSTSDPTWQGWGTALKPTVEPIVMARKPLIGTIAANVLEYGTGAINIDASRIKTTDSFGGGAKGSSGFAANYDAAGWTAGSELGRFPANIILDEHTAELLDEQSEDTSGASRFFYVAKASKKDRNEGLDELEKVVTGSFDGNADLNNARKIGANPERKNQPRQNFHPTVKPTTLMQYLITLVTPPHGTVLDPFAGSGSTGKAAIQKGFNFIGIELTEEYLPIIRGRLEHAEQQTLTQTAETLF
jgi:site-specific DNA-methyltransferase (adenine-specific)